MMTGTTAGQASGVERVRSGNLARRLSFWLCVLSLTATVGCASLPSSRQDGDPTIAVVTDDLSVPVQAALQARQQGKRVLVVFDIDDTLLTMPQDLGSDAWFNRRAAATGGSADAFDHLLAEQRLLFQGGRMRTTQDETAALVSRLQQAGIDVYALTARGYDMRDLAEASLESAGIHLAAAPECGPPLCSRRGRIHDADIRRAARTSLIELDNPERNFRPVSVSDGMMLVAGQDKGVFLQLLMASLPGPRYSAVYFIDDSERNVSDVLRQARSSGLPVHVYHYTRMHARAEALDSDPTRFDEAETALRQVKAAICNAVVSVLCEAALDRAR